MGRREINRVALPSICSRSLFHSTLIATGRSLRAGGIVNFSIYGIWNATQLILATGIQNWIFPVD